MSSELISKPSKSNIQARISENLVAFISSGTISPLCAYSSSYQIMRAFSGGDNYSVGSEVDMTSATSKSQF